MQTLTVDLVRRHILDRSIKDNQVELDLFFSDEEIKDAMANCAREYNSIPPYVGHAHAEHLTAESMVFIYGTVKQLYLSKIAQYSRNNVKFSGGSLQVDLYGDRMKYFTESFKFYDESFTKEAMQMKQAINLAGMFGPVG